ncbi:phosphatidylserine/phosphatidylglycerophosphate/cardiolipin synthase family protein [Acinetobacter guillouiae]|uniref:phospholipase D-like domain-containing protein n=1 Tax=Acinetobacter guillouiae TaxID=106649 RepID=UPI002FDA540B
MNLRRPIKIKRWSIKTGALFGLCLAVVVAPSPSSAESTVMCSEEIHRIDGNRSDLWTHMVDKVEPPQQIQMIAYIFDTDETGLRLLRHLIDASVRGVRVQLLVDGVGPGVSMPINKDLVSAVRQLAPDLEIRVFNPKSRLLRIRKRAHDKLFLAGNSAMLGSSSIWNASAKGWLIEEDVVLRELTPGRSDVFAQMRSHFQLFWQSPYSLEIRHGKGQLQRAGAQAILRKLQAVPIHTTNRLDTSAFHMYGNDDNCPNLNYYYDQPDKSGDGGTLSGILQLIDEARQEIIIVNPYILLVPEVRDLLKRKVKVGVRVVILTASIVNLSNEFPPLAKAYANDLPVLARDGFEVREYLDSSKGRMLHAKVVRVDDRSYFVGSFNFDPLSARHNTENGIRIDSPSSRKTRIAKELDREISTLLKEATLVADGRGHLVVDDPQRCSQINCRNLLRWLGPLIRGSL